MIPPGNCTALYVFKVPSPTWCPSASSQAGQDTEKEATQGNVVPKVTSVRSDVPTLHVVESGTTDSTDLSAMPGNPCTLTEPHILNVITLLARMGIHIHYLCSSFLLPGTLFPRGIAARYSHLGSNVISPEVFPNYPF